MVNFEELPFDVRPDLSPYLIHLTKNTQSQDDYSAFENLINILKKGEIWGSSRKNGFIKGPNDATCFMDVPISSLKYVLNSSNCDQEHPRYEPYGILVTKSAAYRRGCRPVLYLSNGEVKNLRIPVDELWRVVRLEVAGEKWISWMHEREWRCKGNFRLPLISSSILVRGTKEVKQLQAAISKHPSEFKIKPQSIIPLSVVCQGLSYLKKS